MLLACFKRHVLCVLYVQTLTTSTVAQAIQRQGRTTTGLTVQELQAVVNQNPGAIRAATVGAAGTTGLPTATQVITTAALTPAQLLAAQKAGTVTVSSVASGEKLFEDLALLSMFK